MRKPRFRGSEIVAALKEADAGITVKDVRRNNVVSHATCHNWKSSGGGMEASDLKRMKELKEENGRLKQMHANLSRAVYYRSPCPADERDRELIHALLRTRPDEHNQAKVGPAATETLQSATRYERRAVIR